MLTRSAGVKYLTQFRHVVFMVQVIPFMQDVVAAHSQLLLSLGFHRARADGSVDPVEEAQQKHQNPSAHLRDERDAHPRDVKRQLKWMRAGGGPGLAEMLAVPAPLSIPIGSLPDTPCPLLSLSSASFITAIRFLFFSRQGVQKGQ